MNISEIIIGILFLILGITTGAINLLLTGADGIISLNSILSLMIILTSMIVVLNGIKPEAEDDD